MKIALCLSGKIDFALKSFEYLHSNLLARYDIDIFMHFWKAPDDITVKSLSKYRPKKFMIESAPDKSIEDKYMTIQHPPGTKVYNIICMYYSVYQSNLLKQAFEKENNFKYDIVIRSRYDYAINVGLDFSSFEKDSIYVPSDWTPQNRKDYVLNDQFAYGSSENMDLYSSVYTNIDNMFNKTYFHGENFLGMTLLQNNFPREKLSYLNMNNPFVEGGFSHSLIRK